MDDEFISWEHLDLDNLLGEYTDDGEFCIESEWSDDHDGDNEKDDGGHEDTCTVNNTEPQKENNNPTKKRRTNKYCYICPDCSKEYKSASGFRGHVTKKHNKPELKGKLTFF